MQNMFNDFISSYNLELARRLSSIEESDADACAHCGGEDCVCCDIYQDRLRWQSPEEIFQEDTYYDYF